MFTPVETTIGAVLIQLATTYYYWQLGGTIGFSSAICSAITRRSIPGLEIVTGLVSSALIVKKWLPQFVPQFPESVLVTKGIFSQTQLLCLAGLLVGLGTKLGSGCTSGHMIAGLSRLRFRSLVATATFASVAMASVYFGGLYGILGDSANYAVAWNKDLLHASWVHLLLASSFAQVYLIGPWLSKKLNKSETGKKIAKAFNGIYSGFLFGLGLHISGMVNVTKTIGFLALPTGKHFDPSLMLIMVFAVLPNIFVWKKIDKPLLEDEFHCANSTEIPTKFVIGNAIFGLGWGLLGVCPGPGLLDAVYFPQFLGWLASFVTGQYIGGQL